MAGSASCIFASCTRPCEEGLCDLTSRATPHLHPSVECGKGDYLSVVLAPLTGHVQPPLYYCRSKLARERLPPLGGGQANCSVLLCQKLESIEPSRKTNLLHITAESFNRAYNPPQRRVGGRIFSPRR
jgi:hypothetical protein